MIGGIIVLVILSIVAWVWINYLGRAYAFVDTTLLRRIYGFHVLLTIAYLGYVAFNPSDSQFYYYKVQVGYRGPAWMDFYGTSTTFIEWLGYPFIRFLNFSYMAIMALFSFFGFLGFLYFYVFFRENIQFKHSVFGFDMLKLIFFLPNLHFWSSSFGKGSIIFLGLGLFFFGVSKYAKRIPAILLGSVIIYHVRPHVMLVVLVSTAVGIMFSTKGMNITWKVLALACATVAFFFIYQDVLNLVEIDSEEFVTQGLDLSQRASELSKATSGVDISSYSLPMQVFTFLYRPLFVDAPGMLGIIVSFENVFYVLMTIRLLGNLNGWKFLITGNFLSKAAFISFLTISIALAQVSGNLGLAMRQKSQVMILLMFVVIAYLDAEKLKKWRRHQQRIRIKDRLETINQ